MKLHHFHDPEGNFGDDLNHWLWDALLPGWRAAWPGTWLVGVGTLINSKMPAGAPKMVMGSGVGYGELPSPGMLAECRFVSVRGPRSAAALGIAPDAFWRLSVLIPYVVTPVAVALIFSNIFGEKYGLVNNILQSFGLDPVMWKSETLPSHLAIATMVNWRWTG